MFFFIVPLLFSNKKNYNTLVIIKYTGNIRTNPKEPLTLKSSFYPTALKGCRGIVFTHRVRKGRRSAGRAGSGKKFVRAVSQKP